MNGNDDSIIPEDLMAAMRQARDNVIDTDIVFDDADRAVLAAVEHREHARRERDRAGRHLRHLIALVDGHSRAA